MAISPLSDIVLDVARAADPLQYRAAVDKLARLSDSAASTAADSFDALLDAQAGTPGFDAARADLRFRLAASLDAAKGASAKPYQQFEAFVLQTFIQSLLPKDADHVFGDGLAGGYWRSMLAEQIAGQLANSGGIGIAAAITPKDGTAAGGAAAALPGYATSLELDFANSVMPSAEDDDSARSTVGS